MTAPVWEIELRGRLGGLALDVCFEAGDGPTILVGPNGAGKTTVLRAIAGADAGLRGCVRLGGRTDRSATAMVLERPRRTVDADTSILTTLAMSIYQHRCARIAYERHDGRATVRTIEPYALMLHNSRWFLGAYCTLRRGQRLFRVDRIASIEMEPETFEPPQDFDMREFVYRGLAYAADDWKVEVWLDCSVDEALRRFPVAYAEFFPEGKGCVLKRGSDDLEEVAMTLLFAGVRFEIRRPDELYDAFRGVGERALAIAASSDVRSE